MLVVGNYFDGVTDYAGARASDRLLPNSRLLSYAGWGHTALRSQRLLDRRTSTPICSTGTLPPAGTVCPANPNPFLASPGCSRRRAAPLVGLPPAWLFRS